LNDQHDACQGCQYYTGKVGSHPYNGKQFRINIQLGKQQLDYAAYLKPKPSKAPRIRTGIQIPAEAPELELPIHLKQIIKNSM